MTKVLVSVPTGDGLIHKLVVNALLRLQCDRRHEVTIILPVHRPNENNYHHILGDFLRGRPDGRYDFWLNIDSDNPPLNNPLDLIGFDCDVIGCPTPVWHSTEKPGERPYYWNAYKAVEDGWQEWPTKRGLQEVDAVGFGCVLFARRVFDIPELRRAPFQRTFHADGRVEKGTDLAFCERAKAEGIRIWAHFDYPCDHMVTLPMLEVIGASSAKLKSPTLAQRIEINRPCFTEAVKYTRGSKVAIDVGAHIGAWSVMMDDWFQQVIAFEPMDHLRSQLEGNAPNARIRSEALGSREMTVRFNGGSQTDGQWHVVPDCKTGEVFMTRLDALPFKACDLLKIDVEGYELPVLCGAEALIMDNRPVIVIEENGLSETYEIPVSAAADWLKKRGYRQAAKLGDDLVMVPANG